MPAPHTASSHPGVDQTTPAAPIQLPLQLRHRDPRGPCPQSFPRSQPGTVLDAKQGFQLPDQRGPGRVTVEMPGRRSFRSRSQRAARSNKRTGPSDDVHARADRNSLSYSYVTGLAKSTYP